MTEQEILKLCRSLAKRYSDGQEYHDLVSEGVIKCLEEVKKGNRDYKKIKSHARTAMNDYYNHKRKVVHVPKSSKAHSTKSDDRNSGWTSLALQKALYTPSVEIREEMALTESTETLLERKQLIDHIFKVAINCLDQEEWIIIRKRFWDGLSQDKVAEEIGHNQMWVSRKEKSAIEKLCNNL
jgi:RNA polymerase sigma factor (sigma-70 family)